MKFGFFKKKISKAQFGNETWGFQSHFLWKTLTMNPEYFKNIFDGTIRRWNVDFF